MLCFIRRSSFLVLLSIHDAKWAKLGSWRWRWFWRGAVAFGISVFDHAKRAKAAVGIRLLVACIIDVAPGVAILVPVALPCLAIDKRRILITSHGMISVDSTILLGRLWRGINHDVGRRKGYRIQNSVGSEEEE